MCTRPSDGLVLCFVRKYIFVLTIIAGASGMKIYIITTTEAYVTRKTWKMCSMYSQELYIIYCGGPPRVCVIVSDDVLRRIRYRGKCHPIRDDNIIISKPAISKVAKS